jgi:hypothetical protein
MISPSFAYLALKNGDFFDLKHIQRFVNYPTYPQRNLFQNSRFEIMRNNSSYSGLGEYNVVNVANRSPELYWLYLDKVKEMTQDFADDSNIKINILTQMKRVGNFF